MAEKRVLLATIGSLGDLYPYMAISLALRRRGHFPVIATTEYHQKMVEERGIEFHAIRPSESDFDIKEVRNWKLMDMRKGAEIFVRKISLAHLRASHEDLHALGAQVDAIVSHPLLYAAPMVAEERGLPWISALLQPSGLMSEHDPPLIPTLPWLTPLRKHRKLHRFLLTTHKRATHGWAKPIRRLRAERGLTPYTGHPLFDFQFSRQATLLLFSKLLAQPQPDWPVNAHLTGFAFYDDAPAFPEDPAIEEFLRSGLPPIAFTLGASAIASPGSFFEQSILAARRLGRRAILFLCEKTPPRIAALLDESIIAVPYGDFGRVFPKCAAVVHAGGIGTIGQTLRAGVPSLLVPSIFDQPDNADCAARLGVGRVLQRKKYTADRVCHELQALLDNPQYAQAAAAAALEVRSERGVEAACDVIEAQLADFGPPKSTRETVRSHA